MALLDGKVAIVTGAGRGIGRSEAMLLASEGARVLVNDLGGARDGSGSDRGAADAVVDEIRSAGGEAAANADDVASWAGGEALLRQALAEWGRVDILVNNAGILRDAMSFNMDEAAWDSVIKVHLKGHFAPTRHVIAHWRERAKAGEPGGRIVNTSSEAGLYGNAGQANYGAAKGGIASLTLVLARELRRYGITVNAIAPRARTRMTQDVLGEAIAPKPGEFDAWGPDNVASLVGWLASDKAAHVSGQVFVVGGGSMLLMRSWEPAAMAEMGSAWSAEEAGAQAEALFASSGRAPHINDVSFSLNAR